MIFTIICLVFDTMLLLLYFNSILGKRKDSISLSLFVCAFVLAEIILNASYELITVHNQVLRTTITVAFSIITTFILTFFYNAKIHHRIFTALSFQVFCVFSEVPTLLLFTMVSKYIFFNNTLPDDAVMLLFSKIILFFFVAITNVIWNHKKHSYSLQYTLLLIVTPLITIAISLFFADYSTKDYFTIVSYSIILCGMLILNISNYFLLGNILKVKELEEKQKLMNNQLTFQSNKYTQISTAYRSTRSLLHDTKKHFFYLDECIANGEYDKIHSYLKTSMENLERSYSRINTGNLVIDAFVSNHMEMAKQEGIKYITNINVTKDNIQIEDYDLCVLLGNLLDNSIQACRKVVPPKPRYIEVTLCTTNKEFVIHIKNTMIPETERSDNNSDTLYHGYGIENAKKIVDKYYGNYSCFIEDITYDTVVTIPILDI